MSKARDNGKFNLVEEHIDHYISENAALRLKLQSKAEALTILNVELNKCRAERDQFKLMAEQIQDADAFSKKSGSSLAQLLSEAREKNKELLLETESLKEKLAEAEGDIRVLRQQAQQHRCVLPNGENQIFSVHQREELVEQLEKSNLKICQMEADLQSMLDDKEELIKEREAYRCKIHRLNHELGVMLKSNHSPLLDIDALVTENRYLHDRLQQSESETELATQALAKYKSMLDSKRSKGIIKFGTNNTDMIMSHKQVKQLLEKGTLTELPVSAATIADMKSLCMGLLEALNDKMLALSHQRKANRILASRIADLERSLESVSGLNVSVFPSQIMLEDYCSAKVDQQESVIVTDDSSDKNDDDHSKDNEGAKCEGFVNDNDNGLGLPPQLQKLVEKAMEDLEVESVS